MRLVNFVPNLNDSRSTWQQYQDYQAQQFMADTFVIVITSVIVVIIMCVAMFFALEVWRANKKKYKNLFQLR